MWHVHARHHAVPGHHVGLRALVVLQRRPGRFDLEPPRGTCYLADDEIGALLEVLGPIAVVSVDWARRLSLWQLGPARPVPGRRHHRPRPRGFGVTAELASMTPYDLPQRWAAAFAAAGYGGVRYRVRHDPGGSRALALFGAAGERTRGPLGRRQPVDDDVLAPPRGTRPASRWRHVPPRRPTWAEILE